ncbi:hypothetical protein K504DRAFT_535535 [Pleomassaria siparia CBS 279.74]|uniref:F-box domain-containing protein n=1 Tax=Pleomassaria siparia CBS 279.74 TaxID=1314801 RepID=A0A6G1K4Y6_9PLEO|nr:hypothetical protein K504DRAFT_535535 [Pleomassaria siparia CBS 279.74]
MHLIHLRNFPTSATNTHQKFTVDIRIVEARINKKMASLLALPAELRNTIYTLALEDSDRDSGTQKKLKLFQAPDTTAALHPHPFFHLTQASRQVRAEFLPLFFDSLETWNVELRVRDVETYIETFFPSTNTNLASIRGNWIINLDSLYRQTTRQHIDLTPILKFLLSGIKITCVFDHNLRSHRLTLNQKFQEQMFIEELVADILAESLNRLLRHHETEWCRRLLRSAMEIHAYIETSDRTVWSAMVIKVAEEDAQSWMEKTMPDEAHVQQRDWLRMVGWPQEEDIPVWEEEEEHASFAWIRVLVL